VENSWLLRETLRCVCTLSSSLYLHLSNASFQISVSPAAVSFFLEVLVKKPTPWMNPFGLSPMMGVQFPLGLAISLSIVAEPPFLIPTLLAFQGGLLAPGGMSARYPNSSGTMSFYTELVANLKNIPQSGLALTATNLQMGRLLYAAGLYRADCTPGNGTGFYCYPGTSKISKSVDSFLDVLDTTSIQLVKCVFLMLFYVCRSDCPSQLVG